ncbi:hypothetical protein KLVA111870_01865 [Klebsiella variicola]|nr:hypothetical protein SB5387_01019 [Klebsiella variicola]
MALILVRAYLIFVVMRFVVSLTLRAIKESAQERLLMMLRT